MASGRPDWHSIVTISGKYNDFFKPILLDSEGNLIAHLSGWYGGASKDILLDAQGRIVVYLVGDFSGAPKEVAVDVGGKMITVIQGDKGAGVLKTVAVDDTGVMKAFTFPGSADVDTDTDVNVVDTASEDLLNISSKRGMVKGGTLISGGTHGVSVAGNRIIITIDTLEVYNQSVNEMYSNGSINGVGWPVSLTRFDNTWGMCGFSFSIDIGFDDSIVIQYENNSGNSNTISWTLNYSIMTA